MTQHHKGIQVTLEQHLSRKEDAAGFTFVDAYEVLSLVNTTEPKVGGQLTQKEVDALIQTGVRVIVKGIK